MTAAVKPGMLPLAHREILVALRRRRVVVAQLIMLAITSTVTVWSGWRHHIFSSQMEQGAAPFGRELVAWALGTLCLGLVFVVTGLTATAISEERERRTLDLLLCTRMGAAEVIGGKLLGGLVQGVLVVAASVPAVAFGWIFGGVAVVHLAVAYVLVLLLMLLLLSLGMFASARATASKMAISGSFGLAMMLGMPVGMPALFITGFSYANGKLDRALGYGMGLVALLVIWVSAASLLGSVTGISPSSRDAAPAARKMLLAMVLSGVVASLPMGMEGEESWARIAAAVLLGALLVVLIIPAVLSATEDVPPPTTLLAPVIWRSSPWVGPLFVLVCALVVALLVPPILFRKMAAPLVTVSTCLGMIPLLASVSGVASLTRLIRHRRAARNILAFAGLGLLAGLPPLVALISGHLAMETAPTAMLLWLNPAVVVMALAPSATDAVSGAATMTGPWGSPVLVAFMVGHAVIAMACFTVSVLWGKPSVRVE